MGRKETLDLVIMGTQGATGAKEVLFGTHAVQVLHKASCPVLVVPEEAEVGFLEDVLSNLSDFIERQDDLRSRVRGALIYPILLVVIGTLLLSGVLIVLVPKFKPFFAKVDDLPTPTLVLFGISDLLESQWPLVLAALILAAFCFWHFLRSDAGYRMWDQFRFRLPLAGRPMKMVAITRFCRIMGTMLANGVPILQGLQIAKDAAGSPLLADAIEQAGENVRAGDTLAQPLNESGMFPPEIIEMIAVAEESNQLERVLVEVADTVERRTSRQVDQAVRLIEPLILVVLAGTILFVAIGLLYPIFTMSSTLE